MWKRWEILLWVVIVCIAGCGKSSKPLPTTYAVHGKVTYKDGTPVNEGTVQFQSEAEPSVVTFAEIGIDGTYSLITMRNGVQAEGAVAGLNRVLVLTIGHVQGRTVPIQTAYPESYTVERQDNEINLVANRR